MVAGFWGCRTVQLVGKRAFDIVGAFAGLVVLAPVFVIIALAIKLTTRGPVLFRQERVGRNFRLFLICKFRTMTAMPGLPERLITVANDPRITSVGRFLRRAKLDEVPQLFNVLKGDMSLVGPRPELARYVEYFRSDYAEILRVRPGMTDPASNQIQQRSGDPLGLRESRGCLSRSDPSGENSSV